MPTLAQACRLTSMLALCASGCNLLQLDDFKPTSCVQDRDCDAANRQVGIDPATACRAYRCNQPSDQPSRLCELGPLDKDHDGALAPRCKGEFPHAKLDCDDGDLTRSPTYKEVCETSGPALDNDCDGLIDEGLLGLDSGIEIALDRDVIEIAHSLPVDGTTYFALTHMESSERFGTTAIVLTSDGSSDRVSSRELFSTDASPGCATDRGPEHCNLSQLAITAQSGLLLSAGINRTSCGAGQLRVGYAISGSDFELQFGEAQADAALAYGVDLNLDGKQRCTTSIHCAGAHDPAITLLPSAEPAEALALWLAPDGADEFECASSVRSQVVGLGLVAEGKSPQRLHGTHQGHSEPLLPHGGSSTPAIVAWHGAGASGGYFVGVADADALELAFVPRFASGQDSIVAGAITGTIAAAGARRLALATDPTSETGRGLAAVWRSDAETGSAISFAELTFDRDTDPHFAVRGEILRLQRGSEISEGPVLTYLSSGFTSDARGGWFAAWIERERLLGMRIAADHRALDEPTELASGSLSALVAYTHDAFSSQIGYAARDMNGNRFVARRIQCGSCEAGVCNHLK